MQGRIERNKKTNKAYGSILNVEEHIKTTYETENGGRGSPGKDLAKAFLKQGARSLLNR